MVLLLKISDTDKNIFPVAVERGDLSVQANSQVYNINGSDVIQIRHRLQTNVGITHSSRPRIGLSALIPPQTHVIYLFQGVPVVQSRLSPAKYFPCEQLEIIV